MVDAANSSSLFGSANAKQPTGTGNASGSEALSSDFETFLRMLTVQVQNQDPLNPVDATDYATQLATFSSVEQQVLTNDLLKEVSAAIGGRELESLSSWLGKQALVQAPAYFQGTPVAIRPDYAVGADAARLLVYDADGKKVQESALDVTQDDTAWSGIDSSGKAMPSGIYSFQIESLSDGEVIGISSPRVYSDILEIREDQSGTVLRLADGTEVKPDEVSGLRSP